MLENQVERPDEFLSAWLFDSIPFPLCCHVRMREGASPHAARVWAWLDFVGCTWTSLTMETEACLPGAAGNRLALTVPITGPDRECGGGRAQTKRKASSRVQGDLQGLVEQNTWSSGPWSGPVRYLWGTHAQSPGQWRGPELPLEDSAWNAERSGLVHAEL